MGCVWYVYVCTVIENFKSGCAALTTWLGDGFCDDLANVMECCFDDGDCCGPDVDTKYCTNCSCLETNETISTTEGITYLACYTNY